MLCSCQDACVRTGYPATYTQARKVSNPRPSVLETAAPPLARARVNTRMTGCASTMRMRSERRSFSYQRTSVLPVFPASRPAACRSSSDRPDRHGYAPTLNGAVPRSFVSTMCMRAMDIDSRHSADDVNRLSANFAHPVALVTRPTLAPRRSMSFQLPLWACRWHDAAAKSVQNAHDEELLLPPVTPGEKTRRTDLASSVSRCAQLPNQSGGAATPPSGGPPPLLQILSWGMVGVSGG